MYNNYKKPQPNGPWQIFSQWLFDNFTDSEFPKQCLKIVNKRSLLSNFSKLGSLTIYLDEYFNNFDVMYLDDIEFFKFMKEIIQMFNLNSYHFSYFKHHKTDKDLREIHKQLPFMKIYEIPTFLEAVKQDDDYNTFAEMMNFKKIKKTKTTKEDKKQIIKPVEKVKYSSDKLLEAFS